MLGSGALPGLRGSPPTAQESDGVPVRSKACVALPPRGCQVCVSYLEGRPGPCFLPYGKVCVYQLDDGWPETLYKGAGSSVVSIETLYYKTIS